MRKKICFVVAAPTSADGFLTEQIKLLRKEYDVYLAANGEYGDEWKNVEIKEFFSFPIRRQLLEQIADGATNIRFLGLRTDVPRLLKTADVVVMSSHFEGLSLSNIEGMSAEKPFVASDVDGLREVTKGYGLLFAHGDSEALADIIRRLHDDKSFYNEVAKRCYERARQFDIGNMVKEYNGVYSNVFSL